MASLRLKPDVSDERRRPSHGTRQPKILEYRSGRYCQYCQTAAARFPSRTVGEHCSRFGPPVLPRSRTGSESTNQSWPRPRKTLPRRDRKLLHVSVQRRLLSSQIRKLASIRFGPRIGCVICPAKGRVEQLALWSYPTPEYRE